MQQAKYLQVVNWVKQNIANGTLRPGDRLMSENEMSERFGLSRQTIRRATSELAGENLVTPVRGSGTYIGGNGGESPAEGIPVRPGGEETGFPGGEKHMNISVISTFHESYIFPGILKGIERVLTDKGYSMQLSFTDNRLYREEAILRMILEKGNTDGLIVEPVKSALPNPNLAYYRELRNRNIPVLFFNANYPALHMPCVRMDDIRAGYLAAKILLDRGHRKIGAIFKSDDGQGALRYQGYMEAMQEAGCRAEQASVIWLDTPAAADISPVADYLLKRLSGCTGVVCYNDQIAYQVVLMALDRSIKVPEDLAVAGIDDSYLAQVCKVPFSSVVHPKEQLGVRVAENLVRMIRDPEFDGSCLMQPDTVIR